MTFIYRGRKLEINDRMLADYKYVTGHELDSEMIDIYIHNKYIRSNPNPLGLIPSLLDEELLNIVKKGMLLEIEMGIDIEEDRYT